MAISSQIKRTRVQLREHFILANLKHFLPHYVGLWAGAFLFMWALTDGFGLFGDITYESAKAFSTSLMTLSILTITFAIPSCMRMIFATYDSYYSSTIKSILLDRFPVTLLILSAFTSLLLSLAIGSGIWGYYIPDAPYHMFFISLFWALVCVAFLFISIEKLIYFVVKAPDAVLEKLEFNVAELKRLESREDYEDFRHQLASMNDIAATTVQKSTGQDDVIGRCLDAFAMIHRTYVQSLADEQDPGVRRRHLKACSAVDHEVVRIFREACISKNEHAARNIVKTYCRMLADAASSSCPSKYVDEMLNQIDRFQSYAAASMIDELQFLALTDWFFLLSEYASASISTHRQSSIARELAASLRKVTANGKEDAFRHFLKVASNADVELDTFNMPDGWVSLMDRGVFVYLEWIFDAEPEDATTYLGYLRNYIFEEDAPYRSVLPMTEERLGLLLACESASQSGRARTGEGDSAAVSDQTAHIMSIDVTDSLASALTVAALASIAECDARNMVISYAIVHSAAETFESCHTDEKEYKRKLALARCVAPGVRAYVKEFALACDEETKA